MKIRQHWTPPGGASAYTHTQCHGMGAVCGEGAGSGGSVGFTGIRLTREVLSKLTFP